LFSSHSRLHGSGSYRVPWNYGEEAAQSMAKFLDAKHRLMPYLYNLVRAPEAAVVSRLFTSDTVGQAIKANQTGHPLQRAMWLEFPGDRTTHHLDAQYMLGPSLLVAPVLVPEGEATEYYLPAGRWTSFFDPARVLVGPRWVREVVPVDVLPVWVREGTVLPLGRRGMRRPDYAFADGVELHLYEIPDGADTRVDLPTGTGAAIAATLRVTRYSSEVNVAVERGEASLAGIKLFTEGLNSVDGPGGRLEASDAKRLTLMTSM
jgi:alpha-glucosidase (family GH31 glycosyl hydrolase)